MLQLSMKTCLALVWGISVLFVTESMSASVTEPTAEPDKTTKEPISAHAAHNGTETQPAASHPTHNPEEVSVSATAAAAEVHVSTTVKMEHTTTLVAMGTTATGEAKTSHIMTISETAKPTELHQQSHTTVIGTTSSTPTTSAASLTKESVSTTQPDVASSIFSSSTPAHATQASVSSGRSPSSTSITTARPTSGAATVSESISTSEPTFKTSTSSAELSHTPQPVSVTRTHNTTSEFPDTVESGSTTEPPTVSTTEPPTVSFSTNSTTNSIANASTSSAGIYIARQPKKSLIPSAKATTAAPSEASPTTSTEVQPCSTRGIVRHCLIAIASLAALATIFMVSTVILCTKLSARKYKVKKPQQATEMMCISALLPERSYTYRRQRNPVTNGVLVIHGGGDSDEDGGDNVTLSSFLPENERYV